jgi:hypothetical protein
MPRNNHIGLHTPLSIGRREERGTKDGKRVKERNKE